MKRWRCENYIVPKHQFLKFLLEFLSQQTVKDRLTSTVSKKVNDVRTGKRYKLSGVVRSENQKAPPPLRDGTFSTML